MRVKRVRIGIRDLKSALDDFVRTAQAVERGEKVKKRTGVYFTSMEAFRKVLTVQRMNLLHLIREAKPASLHELARLARRNIKNVSDDVRYLAQVGLVELKGSEKKIIALVNYDKILLEIAV
jgi:predicted transcriptional regulator